MAAGVQVGSFTVPASTGNQSQGSFGFQPSVVIFWMSENTADGNAANTHTSIGVAVSSSNRFYIANSAVDAANTYNVNYHSNSHCIGVGSYAGSWVKDAEADFVSFDSGGFTINWTTASATAYVVQYLALGGSDLSNVALTQHQVPATATTLATTTPGFKPDAVLFFHSVNAVAPDGVSSGNASMGIGSRAGGVNLNAAYQQLFITGGADVDQESFAVVAMGNGAAVQRTKAAFSSLDTNGWTISFSTVTAQDYFWALSLKGLRFASTNTSQPTVNGNFTETGLSTFTPVAMLVTSTGVQSYGPTSTDPGFTIGAATGTAARGNLTWDGTNSGTAHKQALDRANVISIRTNDTLRGAGDFVAFTSDGYTLNWSSTDGLARVYNVLLFGAGIVPPDPYPAGYYQTPRTYLRM